MLKSLWICMLPFTHLPCRCLPKAWKQGNYLYSFLKITFLYDCCLLVLLLSAYIFKIIYMLLKWSWNMSQLLGMPLKQWETSMEQLGMVQDWYQHHKEGMKWCKMPQNCHKMPWNWVKCHEMMAECWKQAENGQNGGKWPECLIFYISF